jgi:hypothetical protein
MECAALYFEMGYFMITSHESNRFQSGQHRMYPERTERVDAERKNNADYFP